MLILKENTHWNKELYRIHSKYKKQVKNTKNPIYGTNELHVELFLKYKNEGCMKSRDELLERQYVLIEKYVNQYHDTYGSAGLDPRELIQQGNLSLLDALESYNPSMGTFASYVRVNLKKFIFPFLKDHSYIVRQPHTYYKRITTENKAADLFFIQNNRLPLNGEEIIFEDNLVVFGIEKKEINSINRVFDDGDDEYGDLLTDYEEKVEITPFISEKLKTLLDDKLSELEKDLLFKFHVDGMRMEIIAHNLEPKTYEEQAKVIKSSRNIVEITYNNGEKKLFTIYCNNHNLFEQLNFNESTLIKNNWCDSEVLNIDFSWYNNYQPISKITVNKKNVVFNDVKNVQMTFKKGCVYSPQILANMKERAIKKLRCTKEIFEIKEDFYG